MHDLISLADCTREQILGLLDSAADLKARLKKGDRPPLLAGKTLAMIFEKPSLRTRVTFETGMFQLGGQAIMIHSEHERLGARESIPDVAHNLERLVDGIMARTFSHQAVLELAEHASVPVINGLTDALHPCQILADALTIRERLGKLEGIKLAWLGDGNNVCSSWCNLAARVPLDLVICTPPGYEVAAAPFERAQREGGGRVSATHDLAEALEGADCIYTDTWASMGQEEEAAERRRVFAPYQVNEAAMAMAKPGALFMHCLPAHRNEEVTDAVIDGPQSVVYDQAENRLHAQKAVMAALMGDSPTTS